MVLCVQPMSLILCVQSKYNPACVQLAYREFEQSLTVPWERLPCFVHSALILVWVLKRGTCFPVLPPYCHILLGVERQQICCFAMI